MLYNSVIMQSYAKGSQVNIGIPSRYFEETVWGLQSAQSIISSRDVSHSVMLVTRR